MDPNTMQNILLLQAVQSGNHAEIKRLLTANSNPNYAIPGTENGIGTPLLIAVARFDREAVRLLLEFGADVNSKRYDCLETPWEMAQRLGDPDVIQHFQLHPPPAAVLPSGRKLYQRRKGTAAVRGHLNESKLMALVLLRLKSKGCQFWLGSNVDGVGDLDDMVVRYVDVNKRCKFLFVQAKHRDDPEKEKITDMMVRKIPTKTKCFFNVHENFKNYLMVRQRFNEADSKSIFDVQFDDCVEVAVFTTANCNFTPPKQASPNPLLRTNERGRVMRVAEDVEIVSELCKHADPALISEVQQRENVDGDRLARDFLKQFRIYYSQASEKEIGKLIENLLNERNPQLLGIVYHYLVQAHWMQKDEIEFLTKECDLLTDAKRIIAVESELLGKLTEMFRKTTERFKLEYTEESVRSLNLEWLQGERFVNVFSCTPLLTLLKVSRYFEKQGLGVSTVIIDVDHAGVDCCNILQMFLKQSRFDRMFICTTSPNECSKLADFSLQLEKSNKSVVIVSDSELSEKLKHLIPNLSRRHDIWHTLADTTVENQCFISENKTINFQGQPFKLIELLGNVIELDHVPIRYITGSILLQLMNGDSCEIARVNNQQVEYFVDRTFREFNTLSEHIDKTNFLLVDMDQTDFGKNEDLLVISNTKKRFNEICDRFPSRNVHWFKERPDCFVWQKSSNSLTNLRKFLKYSNEQRSEISSDRFVIIAAEPGMGKSTMLTQLLQKVDITKQWIVRLNLKDFTKQFTELKNKKVDLKVVFKFIFAALNIPSGSLEVRGNKIALECSVSSHNDDLKQLEGKVFEKCYNQGKVILLMDGFDEIAPNYSELVLSFLNVLKSSQIHQMVITTRHTNVQTLLEDNLKVFACTLEPFTQEDIFEFLEKIWKTNLGANIEWNQDRFQNFANELVRHCFRNVSHKSFIRIPLHTEMMATLVKNMFEEFLKTANSDTLSNLEKEMSSCSLFENFIHVKINKIYLLEKNAIEPCSTFITDSEFRESFENSHKRLALCALFDKETLEILVTPEEIAKLPNDLRNVESGKEKKGFVCKVIDGKPQFTHLTFAEYLAAKAIWEKFKSSSIEIFMVLIEKVLIGNLVQNDKRQICRFLQNLALNDSFSFGNAFEKGCLLLRTCSSQQLSVRNECMNSLLDIAKRCMPYDSNFKVESLDDEHKRLILKNFDDAWVDGSGFSLFNYLLKYTNNYSLIEMALKIGIFKLNPSRHSGQKMPLQVALETERVPLDLIQVLLSGTDVDIFNKNAFSTKDWHLLQYDSSVAKSFLEKGFRLQQTPLSLHDKEYGPTSPKSRISVKFKRRFSVSIFNHDWIDHLNLLCENGSGFHHTALEVVEKIVCILKVPAVMQEKGPNWESEPTKLLSKLTELHQLIQKLHQFWNELIAAIKDRCSINKVHNLFCKTDLNIRSAINFIGKKYGTLLHYAVFTNNFDVAKFLLEKGANPNLRDVSFETERHRFTGKVKHAIRSGKATPMHIAAAQGNLEMVKLLDENGASLSVKTYLLELTPLQMATSEGHAEVVQYLREHGPPDMR